MAAKNRVGRGRSVRLRGTRGRHESIDEMEQLDLTKAPSDNLSMILKGIVQQQGITKAMKLNYYNYAVKLFSKQSDSTTWGLPLNEIISCLRVGMFHEAKEIRAACLRALRYLLKDERTLDAMISLNIDLLIARSLDICLDNHIERVHTLRLIRKIVSINPSKCPQSLVNVMVSISNDGAKERDQTVRTCLATISELALQNPALASRSGGICSLIHNVLDFHHFQRINESLLATVLYLINQPRTRNFIKTDVDIEQILAPFTDFHYKYNADSSDYSISEEHDKRLSASKMAVCTMICSWPGLIRLCKPDGSGLQSLIGILYLPQKNIRVGIMDIIYRVFNIQQPKWTSDFTLALVSSDPSEMRDSWRLMEGFVAEEGRCILPHLATVRTNLLENHLAVILAAFINAGLLEALVEIITTSDSHVSVRATILLGELLHMANTVLPTECSHHSHCLPTLIALAASFKISAQERHHASLAVSCLEKLHHIKTRGPIPCSLYLDQILQCSTEEQIKRPSKITQEKLMQCVGSKEADEVVKQAIQDSNVLVTRESLVWDWDLIAAILKWPDEGMKKLDDQSIIRFMKRILYFLKPSNRFYSTIALHKENCRQYTVVACHFVDFLLECTEIEGSRILEEFLNDIGQYLDKIKVTNASQDSLLSPVRVSSTLCQDYFLLIGRFSKSTRGCAILEKTGIFQSLLDLVTITSHECYIKLVVSSLDYTLDGTARIIISKALTATSEDARLYTASFLRILLRAKVQFFSSWGIDLLVTQLYDQSRAVALEALSVLDEACEDETHLHALIKLRPSFLHLGEQGTMLLARFMSLPNGFSFLKNANYVNNELERWHKSFNSRYVKHVEEKLNEALTTYEVNVDGSYARRSTYSVEYKKAVFVPIHLYGQLVQHKEGYQLLQKQAYLPEYFECIRSQELKCDQDIHKLKVALWCVGHLGTSAWGMKLLQEEAIIPEIIKLAEESGVFSLRGTALYVLSLVASTRQGADILHDYGWESVRYNRHTLWPVMHENYEELPSVQQNVYESSLSLNSASGSERGLEHTTKTVDFTFGSNTLHSGAKGTDSSSVQSKLVPAGSCKHSRSGSEPVKHVSYLESQNKPRSGSDATILDTRPTTEFLEKSHSGNDNSTLESGQKDTADMQTMQNHSDNIGEKSEVHSQEDDETTKKSGQYLKPNDSIDVNYLQPNISTNSDPAINIYISDSDINADINKKTGDEKFNNLLNRRTLSLQSRHPRDSLSRRRSVSTGETQNEASGTVIADPVSALRKMRSNSLVGQRSYSNESSDVSKSRSSSFNTSSTTSGVGSFESGPRHGDGNQGHLETSGLLRQHSQDKDKSIHPSDVTRKMHNLKRTPSINNRMSQKFGNLTHAKSGHTLNEEDVVYTSKQDAHGFAAWRTLQRVRTYSSGEDSDLVSIGATSVVADELVSKSRSLDFRTKRNSSSVSLQLYEQQFKHEGLNRLSPKVSAVAVTPVSSGQAEYVGLCLPVDISLIFQVNEGEDHRSNSILSHRTSQSRSDADTDKFFDVELRPRSVSSVSHSSTDNFGYEQHSQSDCIKCRKVRPTFEKIEIHIEEVSEIMEANEQIIYENSSLIATPPNKRKQLRLSQASFSPSVLPSDSIKSDSSDTSKRLCEDSSTGRLLIHKEVIRLVVNLGSSVGTKATEQSLLSLRQKFPKAFKDVCLYSDIAQIMSKYNYRLTARRLIQELFQDLDFSELFVEPRLILGISEDTGRPATVAM